MSRSVIRVLVALSVVAIIGILTIQAVWVRKAYALRERQFRQTAFIALQEVAMQVARFNHVMLNRYAVKQLSSDYFIVNTDSPIDPVTLENFIQTSLRKHNLITDFEYGIYDCSSDQMVYGDYVATGTPGKPMCHMPKFSGFTYYFGIRFPKQSGYVVEQLDGWIWSTAAVLVLVIIFGYTINIVLKQRRLTEVQRDFINNITHELQTPVSTIRIAADVLQQDAIRHQPERFGQYVRILKEESQRLQKQVNNVLQLARSEHNSQSKGQFSLSCSEQNLHTVLTEAAASYSAAVTLDLTADVPFVYADRYHLDNVIHNLIDNAVKYTNGKPDIRIRTQNEEGRLVWSVQDNGIGIATEHHKAIFRQFFRVPTGNVHNAKGFGLGLYYVRKIIKAHRWQIRLDSTLGQGSRFIITCPVMVDEQRVKERKNERVSERAIE